MLSGRGFSRNLHEVLSICVLFTVTCCSPDEYPSKLRPVSPNPQPASSRQSLESSDAATPLISGWGGPTANTSDGGGGFEDLFQGRISGRRLTKRYSGSDPPCNKMTAPTYRTENNKEVDAILTSAPTTPVAATRVEIRRMRTADA